MDFKKQEHLDLLARLQDLKKVPPRNPNAIQSGKSKFLAQAGMMKRSSITNLPVQRHSKWKLPFIQERKMGTFISVILVIGLVFGGSTATVFASQESVPNEFLYPVKLLSEDVQFQLAQRPQVKAELALKYALKRIDEIIDLKDEGLMPPDAVINRLQNQINLAIQYALALQDQNQEAALIKIKDQLQDRERLMDHDSNDPVLLRIRTLLQERIQLVESGIADPDGLYYEFRNGWGKTPDAGEINGTPENQERNGSENTPGGYEFQYGDPNVENTQSPPSTAGAGGNSTQAVTLAPVQGTNSGGNPTQNITPGPTQGTGGGGNNAPGGTGSH